MRKVERSLWIRSCLFAWLAVFAAAHFMHSSATKALLFYGLLTLAFFNCLLQLKMWYYTASNKIGVLKAIKQLELDGPAGVDADMLQEGKQLVDGLPGWERNIWWVACVGGCFLILFVKGLETQGVKGPSDPFGGEGSLTSDVCVTLAADGSGFEQAEMSFLDTRTSRTSRFNFNAPEEAVVRFADSHGKELPVRTVSEQGQMRYIVRLLSPVMSGHRVSYTRTQEYAQWATEEGGVWTHSADFSYAYNTNEFSHTVVLPEGAEIVSVKPWPVAKFTLNKKPTVRFETTRGHNDPFQYTVQYRLLKEASD
jgi:hypothetical protein